MKEFFETCGNLIGVKLLRGKGFVKFSEEESQRKALTLNSKNFNGQEIIIEKTKKREAFIRDRSGKPLKKFENYNSDTMFEAFVGNVSFDTTEQ